MVSRDLHGGLPLPVLSVILVIILVVVLGGVYFYTTQKNRIVNERKDELATTASFKISLIEEWRRDHLRDGTILGNIIPRAQLIENMFIKGNSAETEREIFERLKIFIRDQDYHSILFLDSTGSVRLVYPSDAKVSLTPTQVSELGNSEISLSEFYISDELQGEIMLDLQIPLFAVIENKQVRFGTVIMRIDPEIKLFTLIQMWPTPSKSAEIFLVKQVGDSALFLNELRHIQNTALKLKVPLTESFPSTMVIRGYKGTYEGIDYRGVPVLSYLSRIPDSPWYIVAKIDKTEIYSQLRTLVMIDSIVVIMTILMATFIILYLYRNQRIRYLAELNSTKDKFFSIISHDLRSPFASIKGFADLLVTEGNLSNDEVKKYGEVISTSSQKAVDLLKNLTEWARLQTNRVKFNPEPVDLISIINHEIELASSNAVQKSVRLIRKIPGEMLIKADVNMISLVIRNLLSNAIKFSYQGGTIDINAIRNDGEVLISVCDTGTGMDQEIIERLFKIEENVTTPGTQKEQGSGLGLILVKEFIALHGGQVHVESEPGKCSKVSFTIPV